MMKKLFLIILLGMPLKSLAGLDPGRVAAIELASDQAKKTIESQEKAQLLMTTAHAWIKEEVEATTDFQRGSNALGFSTINIIPEFAAKIIKMCVNLRNP